MCLRIKMSSMCFLCLQSLIDSLLGLINLSNDHTSRVKSHVVMWWPQLWHACISVTWQSFSGESVCEFEILVWVSQYLSVSCVNSLYFPSVSKSERKRLQWTYHEAQSDLYETDFFFQDLAFVSLDKEIKFDWIESSNYTIFQIWNWY